MNMRIDKKICLCIAVIALLFPIRVFAQGEFLKTSISDIQRNPDKFYEKKVEVQAYFYKMDDIWVRSLEGPGQYVGLFVSKPGEQIAPILGEHFGFIFVPNEMEIQAHFFKWGDKITIRGECFNFKSISINGPGIKASELLSGWGKAAKPITTAVTKEEVVSLIKENTFVSAAPAASSAISPTAPLAVKDEKEKYNVYLNGKEYQGLTVGDEYIFEGTHFRVEKTK